MSIAASSNCGILSTTKTQQKVGCTANDCNTDTVNYNYCNDSDDSSDGDNNDNLAPRRLSLRSYTPRVYSIVVLKWGGGVIMKLG